MRNSDARRGSSHRFFSVRDVGCARVPLCKNGRGDWGLILSSHCRNREKSYLLTVGMDENPILSL